jgi:hypothetical protein
VAKVSKKWHRFLLVMARDHEKSYIILSHGPFVMYINKPLGLVHKGSQFPSPTHISKSQHGGKAPTFEPREITRFRSMFICIRFWLFHAKQIIGTCVGSWVRLARANGHPCHTRDLGLGIPCEVVSPNFHAHNGWDCTYWPQVFWDYGLWNIRDTNP